MSFLRELEHKVVIIRLTQGTEFFFSFFLSISVYINPKSQKYCKAYNEKQQFPEDHLQKHSTHLAFSSIFTSRFLNAMFRYPFFDLSGYGILSLTVLHGRELSPQVLPNSLDTLPFPHHSHISISQFL